MKVMFRILTVLGGITSLAAAAPACAAPVSSTGLALVPSHGAIVEVYYYQGHHYPYRYKGRYYNYYWNHRYYMHRERRNGSWHYY
ncbi:MAG TPA: hypothetical protein VMU81_19300 [Acetobacteraceae bacterium]|jgi:hypothetical protein|nr:hypothetical protein [Acetobacteraceae bacterium]